MQFEKNPTEPSFLHQVVGSMVTMHLLAQLYRLQIRPKKVKDAIENPIILVRILGFTYAKTLNNPQVAFLF
jgi:hypothetical protein